MQQIDDPALSKRSNSLALQAKKLRNQGDGEVRFQKRRSSVSFEASDAQTPEEARVLSTPRNAAGAPPHNRVHLATESRKKANTTARYNPSGYVMAQTRHKNFQAVCGFGNVAVPR